MVSSQRGSRYEAVYLGGSDSGVVIRLADGRLGRLLRERVRWSSLDEVGEPRSPLSAGDRIWLESERRGERQVTLSAVAAGLLETPEGLVSLDGLVGVGLLFRAREILAGDRFHVRSRSGSEYHGECLEVRPGGLLRVALTGGSEVNLRVGRLDLETLSVRVPIPLERLR